MDEWRAIELGKCPAFQDKSGAVLPGVSVHLMGPAPLEDARDAMTDPDGRYELRGLRAGVCTVTFFFDLRARGPDVIS